MAQVSTLQKLLKTRYPLTNSLYRQQQFLKAYPTTSTTSGTTPSNSSSTSESMIIAVQKHKTPLPPPPCFNVPDTLDFNTSECKFNDYLIIDISSH